MTAPFLPCVRGCTFAGKLLEDGTRGEPEPRPAKQGLLCDRDGNRLFAWLDEIPDLYASLPIEPAASGGSEGRKSHKISHSPALARLDVIALTDPRTRHELGGDNTRNSGPVYVPDEVGGWARMFTEEQGLASPVTTLTEAIGVLKAWFQTLVAQPWVDEFYTDMASVAKLLNTAHGTERPHPVGTCISIVGTTDDPRVCGTDLYGRDNEPVRCPSCKRQYNGLELVRIANTRAQAERSVG